MLKDQGRSWKTGRSFQFSPNLDQQVPAVRVKHGESVSECVQTVHCAGDCAVVLHTTTTKIEGRGIEKPKSEYTCRKLKIQTQQKITSSGNICTASCSDNRIVYARICQHLLNRKQHQKISVSQKIYLKGRMIILN